MIEIPSYRLQKYFRDIFHNFSKSMMNIAHISVYSVWFGRWNSKHIMVFYFSLNYIFIVSTTDAVAYDAETKTEQ